MYGTQTFYRGTLTLAHTTDRKMAEIKGPRYSRFETKGRHRLSSGHAGMQWLMQKNNMGTQQLPMAYGLACLWEGGKGWVRSLVWAAVRHLVWPAAAGTHPTGPGRPQSPAAASPV